MYAQQRAAAKTLAVGRGCVSTASQINTFVAQTRAQFQWFALSALIQSRADFARI